MLGISLLAYNVHLFGNVAGGQDRLERVHRQIHGVAGPWSGDLLGGIAGTLFSPSRGLFVFAPWIAISLVVLPFAVGKLTRGSLPRWMLAALIPELLVLSKYTVWWGGGSFGPRYWTDAAPLFAIVLGCALIWAKERSRLVSILLVAAIVWSIAIQAVGAFCYPSTWAFLPTDIDLDHQRFWDWRDAEVVRCVREWWAGVAPVRLPGQ